MNRATVSVARAGDPAERDLDLATDLPVAQLAATIARELGWAGDATGGLSVAFDVEARPPGRVLLPHETLLDAGVWDGARLLFRPRVPPNRPAMAASDPGPAGAAPGYVWKRLDDP